MSNVHNLDFGGVELGSCEALLAQFPAETKGISTYAWRLFFGGW